MGTFKIKPIREIVTPADLEMIKARIGSGWTVEQEAAAVQQFVENITFRTLDYHGILVQQCRVCNQLRDQGHTDDCSALAVL